jgi:hypothetical protein
MLCGFLLLLCFLQTSCGGGGTQTATNYTLAVTGTSAAIQHTTQITVTVP